MSTPYDLRFDPTPSSAFIRSAIEAQMETCMNNYLTAAAFQISGTTTSVTTVANINTCMQNASPTLVSSGGGQYSYSDQFYINFGCTTSLQSLSGVSVTDPQFIDNFCSTGSSGLIEFASMITTTEYNTDNVTVNRSYKRIKAFQGKNGASGTGCAFTNTNGVRTYDPNCIWTDLMNNAAGSVHFVSIQPATTTSVVGTSGVFYTGGTASVTVDNEQGTITFTGASNPAYNWAFGTGGTTTGSGSGSQSVPVPSSTTSGSTTSSSSSTTPSSTSTGTTSSTTSTVSATTNNGLSANVSLSGSNGSGNGTLTVTTPVGTTYTFNGSGVASASNGTVTVSATGNTTKSP